MRVKFKANQLYGFFVNPNFTIEREFCEVIIRKIKPDLFDKPTEELWASCTDICARSRKKEIVYKNKYTLEFNVYENADVFFLQCSESVSIILENGDVWDISEIKMEIKNPKDSLYVIELTFSRDELRPISYPLRSDNIEKKSNIQYNRIRVTKYNPTYQQYATLRYIQGENRFELDFVIDSLTKNINIGDVFALNCQNLQVTDFSNGAAYCIAKTSTLLTFDLQQSFADPGYNISDTFILDNLFTYESLEVTTVYEPLIYDIFTVLHPKTIIIESFGDTITKGDDIKKSDIVNIKYFARTLFFLQPSELWKFEFLTVADKIEFYNNNTLLYVTNNNFDIAKPADVDYFEQKEFVLNFPIKQITLKNSL